MFVTHALLALSLPGAFAVLYLSVLRYCRVQGWRRAVAEAPVAAGAAPGCAQAPAEWLLTGPTMNLEQDIHQRMVHYPSVLRSLARLMLVSAPRFGFWLLRCSIGQQRLCVCANFDAYQIYRLFEQSPLLLAAEVDGALLRLRVPALPALSGEGLNPSHLSLVFDVEKEVLVAADQDDRGPLTDLGEVASLLLGALVGWAHPLTHIAAERSAREIAEKAIEALEPSNRYVLALHQGLLYSPLSPIRPGHALSINLHREALLEATRAVSLPHVLDPAKMRHRYYRFLFEARLALIKNLDAHGIDVNPELLFNNMIVHSIDHCLLHRNLKGRVWSIDGGSGIASYWRSQVFATLWVKDAANALEAEHIGRLPARFGFYRGLYRDLAEIDRELADAVLASTSF